MSRNPASEKAATLRVRLQARRARLEEDILARVYGIDDVGDRQYRDGLRRAVSAAFDYGLEAIKAIGKGQEPAVPPQLLVQARLAARSQVSLDTVIRRYCGGNALFTDAVIDESESVSLPRGGLRHLLRAQAASFDHLLGSITREYDRELRDCVKSGDRRQVELVERLLAGNLLDTSELAYDFDAWHIGLVAAGSKAIEPLRGLAATYEQTLLLVERQNGTVWAWLGSRDPQCLDDHALPNKHNWPADVPLAIGERTDSLAGWRLSHRQAVAAHSIVLCERGGITRYADAPLLAAALKDDLLAGSLRRLYLEPLGDARSGLAAKKTLRAYFAAGCNGSSAAAALHISRRTVSNRLAVVEQKIGQPVDSVSAELQIALQLDEIAQST